MHLNYYSLRGPVSENASICRQVADELAQLQARYPELTLIFKGSFDKANRTSINSPRGTGMETGLEIFSQIKKDYGFQTLTDIHLPEQCAQVGAVVDVLQIPAFLCRQTDLLQALRKLTVWSMLRRASFCPPMKWPLSPKNWKNLVPMKSGKRIVEPVLATKSGGRHAQL